MSLLWTNHECCSFHEKQTAAVTWWFLMRDIYTGWSLWWVREEQSQQGLMSRKHQENQSSRSTNPQLQEVPSTQAEEKSPQQVRKSTKNSCVWQTEGFFYCFSRFWCLPPSGWFHLWRQQQPLSCSLTSQLQEHSHSCHFSINMDGAFTKEHVHIHACKG